MVGREATMKNASMIITNADNDLAYDNLQAIIIHFQGSGNPPNLFFQDYTWILYIYVLICVHGFIMNTFLVRTINIYDSENIPFQIKYPVTLAFTALLYFI